MRDDDDGVIADDRFAVGGELVADVGQPSLDGGHVAQAALEGRAAVGGEACEGLCESDRRVRSLREGVGGELLNNFLGHCFDNYQ